jgi:pSer/pThr/pTyr-binding forkhead associated (FHA) protein
MNPGRTERMARLIITTGPEAGKELQLSDTQVIGRLPSNAIPIKDEGSSRQNTRLYRSHGKFTAIDLNSKNGTFVNGDKVDRAELKDGDQITIGSTSFRFVAEASDEKPAEAGPRGARAQAPRPGSPDDVIQYGGVGGPAGRGVSERAMRFSRSASTTGALRWMKSEFSQHSALFRTLLLLGVLLLMAGLATTVYRFAAGPG